MSYAAQQLIDLKKDFDFLVGIDSDGCAFDAMEIKHKECFIPNTINSWGLQAVSKYAREAAEFVNLYSRSRGVNRFPAFVEVIKLLEKRPEVIRRNFKLPDIKALEDWIEKESKLGNPALIKIVEETNDPVLKRALEWSLAVNADVTKIVHGVPPFPNVREGLEKMSKYADAIVVSSTPFEALNREWHEHGLAKYVKVIAGQEMGSKAECLAFAKKDRYKNDNVLMIGDAFGDMNAATKNDVLFYPINPGDEDASWQRFNEEAFDKFIGGNFKGEYQKKIISEFEKYLPEFPPWKI
jgi:phosphoglycolate phosphatase-like HAD superfamily hydrolase